MYDVVGCRNDAGCRVCRSRDSCARGKQRRHRRTHTHTAPAHVCLIVKVVSFHVPSFPLLFSVPLCSAAPLFSAIIVIARHISRLAPYTDKQSQAGSHTLTLSPAAAAHATAPLTLVGTLSQALTHSHTHTHRRPQEEGRQSQPQSGTSRRVTSMSGAKEPLRVLITGAAGQIAYSLIPLVCRGDVFGADQPVILHLLDIPPMEGVMKGVVLEITDCAYPLVHGVVATVNEAEAFAGIDAAFLVGSMPRREGMERKDLLAANVKIFASQGKALAAHANPQVKVSG